MGGLPFHYGDGGSGVRVDFQWLREGEADLLKQFEIHFTWRAVW